MRIVLASQSPRRRELLSGLVEDFDCLPAHIDETRHPGEQPAAYVHRLAQSKALATEHDGLVIGADTTVALADWVMEKPVDQDDARAMLRALSGQWHTVYTAVAIRRGSQLHSSTVASRVEFVSLSEHLIEAYLQTEEPWDKAGAYGIQGFAGCFVRQIEGSYSAIVGLPLAETRELLAHFDIAPRWVRSSDG